MEKVFKKLIDSFQDSDFKTLPFDDEELENTPKRLAKMYTNEIFRGLNEDPKKYLNENTVFNSEYTQGILGVFDIDFSSTCAHHLLPFIGKVSFAYLPDKKIVGISKIPRFIDCFAKRPQLQERLTQQIVDCFQENVQSRGCIAVIEAKHLCMTTRGVKIPDAITVTSFCSGVFLKESIIRQEFFSLLGNSRLKNV